MLEETQKQLSPLSGIQNIPSGPTLTATMPVVQNDTLLGVIEATATYSDIYDHLGRYTGYGLAILLDAPEPEAADPELSETTEPATQTIAVSLGTTDINGMLAMDLPDEYDFDSTENLYFTSRQIVDFKSRPIGQIVYFYDGNAVVEKSRSTILFMSWLTIIGVLLLSVSLYLNVKRIRDFFTHLQKVLIASHSNDFSESFITDNIHCLDVLKCSHKECPVFKNPSKVCYLETGDKAISPKWRNSCIHLNKYTTCEECPVHKKRSGDELMEMRQVVNTIMGLWSTFLSSVGGMLSDMFRSAQGQAPSLDDVAGYLHQMADLTTYSHDLQGVYSKDEVYNQLVWVFETRFGLTTFNLFEVNSSENRMDVVVDRSDIEESHLDVFFNCELCRAKRVAENVSSKNNPHLCPYFGIDHAKEIRYCMPMVMGGRVGAVFTFVVPRNSWHMVRKNIGVMKKYLDETAPTLASLRLLQISKEQALRDSLTGCHNRRFMDEYLGQLEGLHHRNQRKLGFIMADLDHFKMVNDEFGHLAGDEILKQLATILRQNIRKSDLLIRYGGEEFLIILMEITNEGVALETAEKLRMAVEDAKLVLPSGGTLKKTISMGVAEFPADGDQLYRVIKYADVALYQAKDQGRNRAIRFTEEMWAGDEY